MPIVEINLIEGRPPEKKRSLIASVTDAVVETLDVPRETVRVLIREVPPENWGVAGRPKSDSPR
jgi:4-oxalocrotonate tautomerase